LIPNSSSILPSLPRGAEILIIRLRSLGDVVMLTPVLEAVHAWRADLRLAVLVEAGLAPLLEGHPAVSEILRFHDFRSAAAELRRRRFRVTFNQHGGPTSAFLTAAAGSRVRVCWRRCQYGFFYNVRVPDEVPGAHPRAHTVEHRMMQFYATGLPRGPIPRPRVYAQAEAVERISARLRDSGLARGTPYAVLHPGAAYFTKRWALEGFAATSRWLRERRGIEPYFVLGPGDSEVAEPARRAAQGAAQVFESLTLAELIALFAGARIFVGNDSGPMHVAAAAGCPAVVIFGSSDSVTWRPWRAPHRVVQNDFACNPCRGDRCYAFPEPRCILTISREQVERACEELLEETAAARA
jgi:ADP-heptose:LPS heptosyltransferase